MSETIVIDANITIAQVLPLPYSDLVIARMQVWDQALTRIVVPTLWEYEVVSTLRKAVHRGLLTQDHAFQAVESIMKQELEQLYPTARLDQIALAWAGALRQSNAYDSQYLAVAENLGAEFWTADQRLANSVQDVGKTWVHWIGETGG